MNLVIFGASGRTGYELCRQALRAGHTIKAAVRQPADLQLEDESLRVVQADVRDGTSLAPVIGDAEAVLSALGTGYAFQEIRLYSEGCRAIVNAMRASRYCRRLVVVSAGLVKLESHSLQDRDFFQKSILFPFLRYGIGRTVYEDMLRMEEYLAVCLDIAWTILRPGRLINAEGVSDYHLAEDFPIGNKTSRPDLAAAMLAELGPDGHIHQIMAPSTT